MRKKQQRALIDQFKAEFDNAEYEVNAAYGIARPDQAQYWTGVMDISRWAIEKLGGEVYKQVFAPPIDLPVVSEPMIARQPITAREKRAQVPAYVQD